QAGLSITSFPKTFNYTGTNGTSDARKMKEIFTNSEPIRPVCECSTSDLPMPSTSADRQDSAGDMVYPHDGESRQQSTDLSIPGRGIDYQFTRTYRSGVQLAGPLGHNWVSNYDRLLIVANAENLTEVRTSFPLAQLGDVVRVDGYNRADHYVLQPGGSYT